MCIQYVYRETESELNIFFLSLYQKLIMMDLDNHFYCTWGNGLLPFLPLAKHWTFIILNSFVID